MPKDIKDEELELEEAKEVEAEVPAPEPKKEIDPNDYFDQSDYLKAKNA